MYDIKEIELKNKDHTKKRLVITFHDEKMAIVAEFLMADAPMLAGQVLDELESILVGERDSVNLSGNRTHMYIEQNMTTISDLFDERDGFTPLKSYKINTKLLYDLTKMWLTKLNKD